MPDARNRKFQLQPSTFLKAFIFVQVFMYIISLVYSGKNIGLTLHPLFALQPTAGVLEFLGASGRLPITKYHTWWPLITASWLHGGLLHILFNMLGFWTVGTMVIREYGPARMFSIFTLSGAIGFFISFLGNRTPLTIGASAGLCGLIGALWYFGRSAAGKWGLTVYRQTSGWLISLGLFGMFLPSIDNWGHAGGFAGGVLIGWILKYKSKKPQSIVDFVMAATLALLTLVLLLRPVIKGFILIYI